MKKITMLTIFMLLLSPFMVAAQGIDINTGNDIGFGTIHLPTFLSLEDAKNFSFFSYIALAFNLVFIGIVIFWVVIALRSAITVVNSRGDEGVIKDSNKKLGNVFWSITYLIGFFALVAIVAGLFGLGGFWEWPKRLSVCQDGQLYFAKALELAALDEYFIDDYCFGSSNQPNPQVGEQCRSYCRGLYPDSRTNYDLCLNACFR